jgi:seryl-tRNA synthetase
MSNESESTNPLDPFGTMNSLWDANLKNWKSMRDSSMDSWSKMMIDTVNSDEYSRTSSQWLDTYLTLSQPFRRIIDLMMTQVLTNLNMPMRTDVTSLAERLTNIETRLDDQDAKLDDILSAIKAVSIPKPTTPKPATNNSAKAKGAR